MRHAAIPRTMGHARLLGLLMKVLIVVAHGSLVPGCTESCAPNDQLAELVGVAGVQVDRDSARAQGAWRQATAGDRFYLGDGLRTGQASRAELALSPTGRALVEPRTVLRFLASAPQNAKPLVALEEGVVEIVAEQADLEIHTTKATARLSRGSKLKLSATGGRERFDVLVGRVTIAHAGETTQLTPAQTLELGEAAGFVPVVTALPAEGAANDAGTAEAALIAAARRPDLTLSLQAAIIHVAQPPVDVHITEPACEHPKLQLLDDAAPSPGLDGSAVLRLDVGKHKVRLLCAGEVFGETQLIVRRDAAKVELPRRAQNVRVEADGRRYTILYQNLLPTVTFAWPGAPAGDHYELLVRRGKQEQSFTITRPEHALSGSALGEGEHKFWFRDARGRSSKPGQLRLSFDNSARSAYLASPEEGGAATPQVWVEGAALQRSEVSAEGQPLALDEKGHFHAEVLLRPGRHAVAVRVDHPESGVHYYVRRLR